MKGSPSKTTFLKAHFRTLDIQSHIQNTVGSFDIMQITLLAEQLTSSLQQLQPKMATDDFFLQGGGAALCYSPARNLPLNFLDLAFERRFLALAW